MQNRHALPLEVSEVVKPRYKIPLERRNSFILLKKYVDTLNPPSKTDGCTPVKDRESTEEGMLSLDNTDEWINNYH